MVVGYRRVGLGVRRIRDRIGQSMTFSPVWQFVGQVAGLIWSHKLYSLAIFGVTILQEFAALWPVNLLGDFVDRLDGGDLGNVVWLLMGASVLSPAIQRANVILRHKMFYETDYEKRVELVLKDADSGEYVGSEAAGAAYTRTVNAVSGITNAAYHVLGSFTPVIIKAVIVSGRLLGYNQLLGLVYLATLMVPGVMTLLLNNKLRVLRDSQYSVMGDVSGAGIRTIGERDNEEAKSRFLNAARLRTDVLIALVAKGQSFLYVREAALIGSQFLVVFLALSMRQQIGITAGDFTKIVGYTAQVAAAFISAASCLDSIISNSRAYHVYSTSGKAPLFPVAPIRPPRGKAVR